MPFAPSGPSLKNRQELFCRHMARGASGAAAARAAGYATASASQQGGVLLTKPHIRSRIEDLRVRREAARQTGIAEMVDRLRALMKLATDKGDYRTAVRCIETEARLCGLFPDRNGAGSPAGFAGADPLLDGIDPRHPDLAAAEAEAWAAEFGAGWRDGMEPDSEAEPDIVPHVYEGFEGRPVDEFTPETDFAPRTPMKPKKTAYVSQPDSPDDEPAPDGLAADPIAGRASRAEAILAAELAHLAELAPPRAVNPAAPAWARHPDPLIRGAEAERFGWNEAWERG